MGQYTKQKWFVFAAALSLIVAGCTVVTPSVSPTATVRPPAASPTPVVPSPTPTRTATPTPSASPSPSPSPTPVDLKILKTAPESGPVGTGITITGDGFTAGKNVDLTWSAWEGTYITNVIPDNIEYGERSWKLKRVPLGSAVADIQGKISVAFTVPEDFGETHEIFAIVDGKDFAKGAFRIIRTLTLSAAKGIIGDPIVITVKGMSPTFYQSQMAVRWDNHYTGYISTITTRGTGVAVIRAAGPIGAHTMQVFPASHTVPYLNSQEGPNWNIFGQYQDTFTYTVTDDKGAPASTTEWPKTENVTALSAGAARTTSSTTPAPAAKLSSSSGPILTKVDLAAAGLPANTDVDLQWVTVRGNRASSSGWSLDVLPLTKATVGSNGSLQASFTVPDDLGGWHAVRVMAGSKVLSETPYYVERSLLKAEPRQVKAGDKFTIQMKGIGWTELDNGVALTYDNSFVGMACGFNSNGNITLTLTATGGPGTHIIDIYPMIYEGHPNKQIGDFEVPQLTALTDHPSLALGYKLPIFRTAIEITP